MTLVVTHTHGHDVSVRAGDAELARYVYAPFPQRWEAPKPYVHPLRTLSGDVVTIFRPHDHRWHKGLQLTATDVSGTNIWGGHTYVRGEGYQVQDNLGAMRPTGPVAVHDGRAEVTVEHGLEWVDSDDVPLATERRVLRFHGVDLDGGWYALDLTTQIAGARGAPLVLESPNIRGMTGSGYSGLWWRGPRSFTDGALVTPDGVVPEDELRGRSVADVPWVAYVGRHDDVDRSSTLVFTTAPENKADAAHWFTRTGDFAGVNPSWAFHEPLVVPAGETMHRRYRVIVATGEHPPAVIEQRLAAVAW
ncbi:DUF6807 domain-containing protein [Jiangella rhizosphaerae]|uniref:Oxidoreductase n=1 Tax=Jiangella rhizosphaerae TaxID=2293569 RepID=A0A418KPF9_9ACTN|nr:PmoA family protein [Jiangella rhizosphaerae]RIQ21463.1 oxidoreductase [Jiangella rhizosphaerae]